LDYQTLITGRDSFLGHQLFQSLSDLSQKVVGTTKELPPQKKKDPSYLIWDPLSPLSTKNLFHTLSHSHKSLNTILYFLDPHDPQGSFFDQSTSSFEEYSDYYWKGSLLFLREALNFSRRKGGCTIHLGILEEAQATPFAKGICSGVAKVAERIIEEERLSREVLRVYHGKGLSREEYFSHLLQDLLSAEKQKKSKQWINYQGKRKGMGPFSLFNN